MYNDFNEEIKGGMHMKKVIYICLVILFISVLLFVKRNTEIKSNKQRTIDIVGNWINKEDSKKVVILYKKNNLFINDVKLKIKNKSEEYSSEIETVSKDEGVSYTFYLDKEKNSLLILRNLNEVALKPIELIK